ncbi:Protein RRP5 [Thelohanellus kitauei]|uniref:Protein RRP5 n=1 Tax=Thelohanellus kitauei TaxID=669202 RepID=A0A0C2NJ52_THEKT|nr:Protein RRP5 [Thelohanellus kitauei]
MQNGSLLKHMEESTTKVGDVVECVAISINKDGIEVQTEGGEKGFLTNYLVGNLEIKKGQKIKCKVLNIDATKGKIYLSSNHKLIDLKEPILKDYSKNNEGNWYSGVVQKIEKSYLVLKFFNNISGLLHRNDMHVTPFNSLESLYSVGDIIRVRVLSSDPDKNRLTLSLRIPQSMDSSEPNTLTELWKYPIVNLINPQITESDSLKASQEFISYDVAFDGCKMYDCRSVIVPYFHLTDFVEHIPFIRSMAVSGLFYGQAVLLGRNLDGFKQNVATFKQSIIQAVSMNVYPKSMFDVSIGMCLSGYVLKNDQVGSQIMIGMGLVGFVPSSFMNPRVVVGESVQVFVKEIDHQKNRIILTCNYDIQNDWPPLDKNSILTSLLLYFKELKNLTNLKLENLNLQMGHSIKFKVVGKENRSLIAKFGDVPAIIYTKNDEKVKKGATIYATVAFWDLEPIRIYAVVVNEFKHSEGRITVKILKHFGRFSLGVTENSSQIVFVYSSGNIFGEMNTFELDSFVECSVVSSFYDIQIALPVSDRLLSSTHKPISCTVAGITPTLLKVKTQSKKRGVIHISEVNIKANEGDRPLTRFKVGDLLNAFTLNSKSRDFSLPRYRKMEFTLRSVPLSNGSGELITGDQVICFISFISKRWIFVEVSSTVRGYMSIIDLKPIDDDIHDPLAKFTPGTCIKLFVVGYDMKKQMFKLSKYKDIQLSVGEVVVGRVYKHDPMYGISVDLPRFNRGRIHVCNISESFEDDPHLNYPVSSYLQCRILQSPQSDVYPLSLKHVYSSEPSKSLEFKDLAINHAYQAYVVKVTKNKIRCLLSDKITANVRIHGLHSCANSIELKEKARPWGVIRVVCDKIINETSIVWSLQLDKDLNKCQNISLIDPPVLCIGEGFDWKTGKVLGVQELEERFSPEVTKDDGEVVPPEKMKKLSEKEIRVIEAKLASNLLQPTTPEDFDRLVAKSPNSSIVWINYMAYYLQAFELEKARKIVERALKQICYREEAEIYNIYLAYINMECLYGTSESLDEAYTRALAVSKKKSVIKHMIELFQNLNQTENAERECLIYIRSFSSSKKGYFIYGKLLAMNRRFNEMKNLLRKAIQNLPERKQIPTIVHFALLEFKFGDIKRGSTLFEKVLNNFPKKLDVWFVYIDQLVKASAIDQAK